MSAQNQKPGSALGALAGMVGLSAIIGLLATVMVTPALAVTGMAATNTIGIFDSLPEYIRIDPLAQRNELYAQVSNDPEDGYVKIAEVYSENREEVDYDQISQYAIDAAIAGEDRRFYSHGGVDVQGIVRAAIGNIAEGDITGGGSTITQQLVKNIFINRALQLPTEEERIAGIEAAQETSLERKLNEAKLAIGLEKEYTKDEIMLAYLNIAGFGGNTYGIEAASQQYFGSTAADLTIAQAASLIAIVQQPGARSLLSEDNYAANERRRDVILNAMLDEGYITAAEHREAIGTPVDEEFVTLSNPRSGCIAADPLAQHMCDYIVKSVDELEALGSTVEERQVNWRNGGYEIYTTLDMTLQKVAQDSVRAVVPADIRQVDDNGETQFDLGGATVSVESGTGRVLTMAQNKSFFDGQGNEDITRSAVNFSTDRPYGGSSGFQTGSTYKVFALVEWLQQGRGLQEVIDGTRNAFQPSAFTDTCNGPWGGEPYEPANFAGAGGGFMTVLQATINSVNTSYVAIAEQLDLCGIRDAAADLGVHRADGTELQTNPSSVLGTNEIAPMTMAAAFAAIANGGQFCEPIAVDRIVDRNGTELPGQQQECRQAIDSEVAAATTFAMREVVTQGTARASNPGGEVPVVGKTGTSDNARHTWMVGASTNVGTAVWVGNIIGELIVNSIPGGTNMRHEVFRPIMAAANSTYGGDALPEVPERLLRGQGVTLPDVIGQTPEQARQLIESLNFRFVVEEQRVDSQLPEGVIATQNPGPGAFLSRGTQVRVQISAGNQIPMPDVVSPGYTLEEAQAVLREEGFMNFSTQCREIEREDPPGNGNPGPPPGDDEEIVEPIEPEPEPEPSPGDGLVIEQRPAAGEIVKRDANIRLTVQRDNC